MNDFQTFKEFTVRYWERRRIFYNLALVPPAFAGYSIATALNFAGSPQPHVESLLFALGLYALAANICYSFSYAMEFLCGNDDPESWWMRYGRTAFFICGVIFAMALALIGGRNIADMQFDRSALNQVD